MYDHNYDLENEVIQEENDYETGENGNHRPFTSDQSMTGKRQKVKTNNFYGIQSADRLPVVYPQHRPYSDKGVKMSSNGSRIGQNSSFKSQDRSSYLIAKDLEYDQPNKVLSSPKRYLVMAPSGPQKNSKLIPKNIPQDKERLYDENMSLKNIVHGLREENLKLKTKVLIFEKDAVKYEKMMAEQEGGFVEREFVPKANDSHLLVGLKNKLIEVENTLQEKESELSKLKKSVKVTKINEMEVQLKISTEESYRLKGILEQLLKENSQNLSKNENKAKLQEECMIQAAQIKALEKDHEQLVKIIKNMEQQGADYDKKISDLEKKKRSETQKLKKLGAEKEKENRKLKEENLKLKQELETTYSHLPVCKTSLGTKRPASSKEDMLIQELEKKRTENLGLMDQLTEKNNQIQQLEKKLKNAAKNDKPPTLTSLERPAAGFRKKSERFSQPILLNVANVANVEEVPVAETKPQPQTKIEKPEQQIPNIAIETKQENAQEEDEVESVSQELENEIQESERMPSVPRKRVQKVRAEDVKDLGYRINLCLRTNGITFDDLSKTVWPDHVVQTGRLRIIEAIEILADEPFNLQNEEDATMIARYLIEENHEDYLYYDPETEGDLVIVKSILRKLIGTIPTWSKETQKKLHDSVSETVSKNHLSFRENLRVICKDGNLNKKALQEVCKIVEVSMSDEQLEFIITKLFEKTNDTLAMPIEGLFEVFYRKPQTPEPVQQPIQISAPVTQKKPETLSLSSETKQNNNDFTIPESKPFQKVNESPLRNKTPPQETILKEEPIKAKTPREVEIPKIKQLESPKKVEEEKIIQDIESEANLEEENYAETPKQNKEQEQNEDEYQFEEEEQDKNHNLVATPPSDREEKAQIPDSTKRSESQPTSKNQNEDRKEIENEDYLDLNPTSEREEAEEIKRSTPEEKAAKEQNESENEYQDDAEEEIEEEDEKENLSLKNNGKAVKAEKNESGDEEYDNEDMGFEEIEDDA